MKIQLNGKGRRIVRSAPLAGISAFRVPPTASFSAFTLLEVLIASAVLAFLLVVFLSISDYASRAWKGSQQKMEDFSTARVVMNRFRADLESIVIRPDLPLFPGQAVGFMTGKRGVAGSTNSRLLSYVEYGLQTNTLLRKSKAYTFDTGDAPPFSTNTVVAAPVTTTSSPLASGVIGFQTAFLNKDGSWSLAYNSRFDTNAATASNPSIAIRISLLVVSGEGMKRLQSTGKISDLTSSMAVPNSEATNASGSPEAWWNGKINGDGIDPQFARFLHAFERLFFLPN